MLDGRRRGEIRQGYFAEHEQVVNMHVMVVFSGMGLILLGLVLVVALFVCEVAMRVEVIV